MTNRAAPESIWIDEMHDLERLVERLRGEPVLGFDTEFIRERSYFPQLCLVQVAGRHLVACIDVLRLELEPLVPLLESPDTMTVMHAARQDLEALQQTIGHLPRPLFDTQVAAALCGGDTQIAYAHLVEQHFGVALDKSQARTDWARRPLSKAQLHYAVQDVLHLPALRDQLADTLSRLGREGWLDEEMDKLLDPALYAPDPHGAWRRVKGGALLRDPRARGALRHLADWREREAIRRDRPRQWIAADPVLLSLAERRPADRQALSSLQDIPHRLVERYAQDWLESIGAGDPSGEPIEAPPERLDAAQKRELERLQQRTRARAAELGLRPELLAPRRELEALVRGSRPPSLTRGWRFEALGRELLDGMQQRAAP